MALSFPDLSMTGNLISPDPVTVLFKTLLLIRSQALNVLKPVHTHIHGHMCIYVCEHTPTCTHTSLFKHTFMHFVLHLHCVLCQSQTGIQNPTLVLQKKNKSP